MRKFSCIALWLFALLLVANSPAYAQQKLVVTKIYDVKTPFDTTKLSKRAKFNVRFTAGGGKYALDEGREAWYQRAKLVRNTFYEPFGEHYIAPWKLVPVGQTDQVEAVLAGAADALGKLDRSKIKFVTADGKGIAAKDEGTKWTLTVPATGAGQTDNIFAVYEKNKNRPLTVGKLRVVSYAVQRHTVTLVPVGVDSPNGAEAAAKLNKIYAPYGVEFTVKVDDVIKDLASWQGRTFQLEGNGFFTRENADMAEIRKAYQAERGSSKEGYCVFVLGAADASSEDDATQQHGAQGDMPRGQRFGYIFGGGGDLGWLLAHELGHGVFTLKHLNEANYAGAGSLGTLANLMDYTGSTALAAFQWNIIANPAVLTALDSDDASKAGVPRPAPKVKQLPAPILFARSGTRLGKDKNGQPKEDLQQNSLTKEQKQVLGGSLLSLSDEQLFAKLRSLAEWTAGGSGEQNTLQLIEYFKINKIDANSNPVFFSSKYMDKELNDTRVVDNFFTEGKVGVLPLFNRNHTKENGLNVFPLKDGIIESDRPIFEEWIKFFRGMWFAVHDISSFEVFITGFEYNADNTYNVEFKLVVYDHFGLDYADITDLSWLAKPFFYDNFKAWYILQHDRGYKPFITKLECARTYYNQKTNVK